MSMQVELRFPASIPEFEAASERVRAVLDAGGVTGQPGHDVQLVFEEIVANIIRHGATTEDVRVSLSLGDREVVLTFEDNGVPFNPLERPAPPVPASLDEAGVGGLGLVLVRRLVTRMTYARTAQHRNHLTLAVPIR